MHAHKPRLCGPRKMHEHRFCKVLKHASFPFKSTEGSARPRYTSRDPESAESPSEGPAGSKCAGGGSARPGCLSTEPVRAKCPSELRPARLAIGLVLDGGNRELAFGSSPAAEPEKGVGRGWARPSSAASSIIVLSPPHPRQFFGNFSSSFAMSRRAGRRRRGTSTCSVGRCRTPGEVPNAPRAPPPHRRPSRPPNISDRGVLTCNDLLGGEGEEAGDTRFLVRCFLWRRCCWVRSKPAEGPARCDRLRSITASKIQVPKRT